MQCSAHNISFPFLSFPSLCSPHLIHPSPSFSPALSGTISAINTSHPRRREINFPLSLFRSNPFQQCKRCSPIANGVYKLPAPIKSLRSDILVCVLYLSVPYIGSLPCLLAWRSSVHTPKLPTIPFLAPLSTFLPASIAPSQPTHVTASLSAGWDARANARAGELYSVGVPVAGLAAREAPPCSGGCARLRVGLCGWLGTSVRR